MKKKITAALGLLIAVVLVFVSILVSSGTLQEWKRAHAYEKAVETLKTTTLNKDGSYQVTEELLTALANVEYTNPKSVIFMIGDGMGFNIVEATQIMYAEKLYEGKLAMNHMPLQSSQCTYSVSDQVTDSAAGATAFSTGFKTANKVIAMDAKGETALKTVLELAAEKGKSTGIVATEVITEATPAVYVSHVPARIGESEIATMQLEKFIDGSLDLAMGGGSLYYQMASNAPLLEQAMQQQGLTFAKDWESAVSSGLPLAGLFSIDDIDTIKDTAPSLAEMTDLALNLLGQDENGFFLMVEGSQIDNYAEHNAFKATAKNTYDFDCAVAVALKYVAMHPDTVLIITADHETGGVTLPENPAQEELGDQIFTTKKHTYEVVPVYAAGYGTEVFADINENTDLGIFVASVFGEENFGAKSEVHTLTEEVFKVTYSSAAPDFVISLQDKKEEVGKIRNARVLHVTMKNTGDETAVVPWLTFTLAEQEYTVEPQIDWMDAGETVNISYILPVECWADNMLSEIDNMLLTNDGSEAAYEFSKVRITHRDLEY